MDKKGLIRKVYFLKRKKKYFDININFFYPLIKLIKNLRKNKKTNISLYYPNSYEVDVLKILDIEIIKFKFLLPVIEKNKCMSFYHWKKNDVLNLNKYGIPEPIVSKKVVPDISLVPLLAFDRKKNRIGYGKGFYDRYLNKCLKINKKIISVGVAFSFQKNNNLPHNNKDYKLDYVITEKGIF